MTQSAPVLIAGAGAERSEVTSPVEHQPYTERIHGIKVHGRRAGWIDHAAAARNVHAAEELQDQLGGLSRVECAIRTVFEDGKVEVGRFESDHSRPRAGCCS